MRKTICVDAGHSWSEESGGDTGAVNGLFKESVAALIIAKKVGSNLTANGYKVVYTRTKGINGLQLSERCKISNDSNAHAFVSIHLNSAENKEANGIETLRYSKVGDTTKKLADTVQKRLITSLKWRDRGVKIRDDLFVLRHTKAPAILVETGFISNDDECRKLFQSYYQSLIAKAIADGVSAVIGE